MRYRKHYKQSQKTKSTCLYYKRDIIQEVYKINKGIVNTLAEKQRQIINGQETYEIKFKITNDEIKAN